MASGMSETDINQILVNGASISLQNLKRARSYESLLFYYAEISVYLEVSLSEGAGISDWSRATLSSLFAEAAEEFMQRKRSYSPASSVSGTR
ncbi:excinuclease ABC subunit C [Pokkaliibacter plantistimulans]|uniref:Excinuclease ABC subunit C n=2 Tax=Pseudomonadota TaxID=1224 RepID=A0A2S5KRF7_9PROT|nr:excinuclease ABC subunit C [Pokkaliibacter plantistimulans]